MKYFTKFLLALLIPFAFLWLAVGFVFWNWNPQEWSEGARFLSVLIWFIFVIPIVGFYTEVK